MTSAQSSEFSLDQQVILAYAPKPAAIMSIISSVFLIQKILLDPDRRKKVYHRIVLVMSVHTTILSLALFLGTWPMPKNSLSSIYGAIGTERSCIVQGSIIFFESTTVASFYLSLSLFSFFAVRHNFKEEILRKYERWLHGVIYIIPIALVYNAVHKRFLNPAVSYCFISSYPKGCYFNDDVPCIYGGTGIIEFGSISSAYFCLTLFTAVTLTLCLYFSVRKKERLNGTLKKKQKCRKKARLLRSKMIAMQAGFYFGVFFITFIVPLLTRSLKLFSVKFSFPMYVLGPIMLSIQGVANLVVYQRLLLRKRHRNTSLKLPNLAPLEKRLSLVQTSTEEDKSCVKLFCMSDQAEFSIFDGTNPSVVWSEFIDTPDCNLEINLEDGNQQGRKKLSEQCLHKDESSNRSLINREYVHNPNQQSELGHDDLIPSNGNSNFS
mmetsp:Transcript_39238/g.47173  ORF Transcript_39238/g.47173 Transcript_39238/m.47173 type:complete len:436 (-) Transcript_39238:232-1539(-)